MKVTANVFGPDVVLKEEVSLDRESATLEEVLRSLVAQRRKALKRMVRDDLSLEKGCVVLVNGRNINSLQNLGTTVNDGDEITLTVLMAGG